MATGNLGENEENFLKGTAIILNTGTKLARKFLERASMGHKTVADFLYSKQKEIQEMNLSQHQHLLIFPTSGCTDIQQWDLCLLASVLRCQTVCESVSEKERTLIKALRDLRHDLYGHIPNMAMTAKAFKDLCLKFNKILRELMHFIEDKEFRDELFLEFHQTKSGHFYIGGAISALQALFFVDKNIEKLHAETKKIVAILEERGPGEFEMRNQVSKICEMLSRPSTSGLDTGGGRRTSLGEFTLENKMEVCDIEFSARKKHPQCRYFNGLLWSFLSLPTSAAGTLEEDGYPGTTGTFSFDTGTLLYVPLCIYVYPLESVQKGTPKPSATHDADIPLVEICLAPYSKTASLQDHRDNQDTLAIRVFAGKDTATLQFVHQQEVQKGSISISYLKDHSFRVDLGLVVNGPLSKVSVIDVLGDSVVHEFHGIDFNPRLVALFGLFQKEVWCILFTRMRMPVVCHTLCKQAISLRDNIKFDLNSLHRNGRVVTFPGQQCLLYDETTVGHSYVEDSPARFKTYTGVRGTIQFQNQSVDYFSCYIVIFQSISPPQTDNVVAEVSLCRSDDIDRAERIDGKGESVSLQVQQNGEGMVICVIHEAKSSPIDISSYVVDGTNSTCIHLGCLIDAPSNRVHIIDWDNNKHIWTVEDVNFEETMYPVFGVFREGANLMLYHKCLIPRVCHTLTGST